MFMRKPQPRSRSTYASQNTRPIIPIKYSRNPRPPGPRPWPFMFSVGLFSMILPATGHLLFYIQHSRLSLVWTAILSMSSLMLYSFDKKQALTGGWRLRESWLLIFDLLGGWPGGFVGQWWCRHKVRKTSYQLRFWTLVLVHNVFWGSRVWRQVYGLYTRFRS